MQELLRSSLALPSSLILALIQRCPHLLVRQPEAEAVAALQQLFGGRQQLAAAVHHFPGLLLLEPARVRRQLAVLAQHLHCDETQAAAVVAEHPALLSASGQVLGANARCGPGEGVHCGFWLTAVAGGPSSLLRP